MIKFKYRYCKVHMAQYLSGDLCAVTRRRIARFIDECQDCYKEYLRQRDLSDQLQRDLPVLGRPDTQKLNSIWLSLQTELAPAAGSSAIAPDFRPPSQPTIGQGFFIMVLVIALLLPMVLSFQTSLSVVDLPPRPQVAEIVRTPTTGSLGRRFDIVLTQSRILHQEPVLKNTPAPRFLQ